MKEQILRLQSKSKYERYICSINSNVRDLYSEVQAGWYLRHFRKYIWQGN
jgi:hypothetical protein